MGRRRRRIQANHPHELIIRAREGLPFTTTAYMRVLIESALARSQRQGNVTICHYVWMGNHAHILFIPRDTKLCIKFYTELPKRITEYLKRLLGLEHLLLWEGRPIVAHLGRVEDVIDRIGYIYANPAKANLVDKIEDYPGLSTWNEFMNAPTTVEAACIREVPWIRQLAVKKLPSRSLSIGQDRAFTEGLRAGVTVYHTLSCHPHAWMKCYQITDPEEVKTLNRQTLYSVREHEARARSNRAHKEVMGAERLRQQKIMKSHKPEPKSRSVFVISADKDLRISYIQQMDDFDELCISCYRMEMEGVHDHVPWPPGAIRPYLSPRATAVGFG